MKTTILHNWKKERSQNKKIVADTIINLEKIWESKSTLVEETRVLGVAVAYLKKLKSLLVQNKEVSKDQYLRLTKKKSERK